MERSYSSHVRGLAEELLRLYPNAFTTDFEENKTLVEKMILTESKLVRNKVAGFISRVKAREASGQTVTVPIVSSRNEGRRRRRRSRRR